MPSHDNMIPVPIKMMQPPLNILDPNLQINNSSPHPGVIHTSPQTPHVSFEQILNIDRYSYLNIFNHGFSGIASSYVCRAGTANRTFTTGMEKILE